MGRYSEPLVTETSLTQSDALAEAFFFTFASPIATITATGKERMKEDKSRLFSTEAATATRQVESPKQLGMTFYGPVFKSSSSHREHIEMTFIYIFIHHRCVDA
jgi:hypothetical protein